MFKEDKNLYETVFYILPDAVILIDNKGFMVGTNDKVEEWLGWKKEEIINKHLLKLPVLTTKAKIIIAKKFADRMLGKMVSPYEVDFKAKNGETRTGLIRASIIKNDKGEISHDLALITDTTKDRLLSAQVADAERKYKYLFDNLPYGFAYHKMIFDKDNKPTDYVFEEVNSLFEKMTGLQADKIIGKKISKVIPSIKDDKVNWIEKYGEVVEKRLPIIFEAFSESFNKWFKVAAYSPEESHFVSIFFDITDEKKNEKETAKITKDIEKNVEELSRMNKIMENRESKLEELRNKLNNKE